MTFTKIEPYRIDPSAKICSGAVIGKPFRPLLDGSAADSLDGTTIIEKEVYVGYYSIVGSGTVIKEKVILDDFSTIECEVTLGSSTLVIYRAQICNEASIGEECVIGGFVAERVVVGKRSRVFGRIVHSQYNPRIAWDDPVAEEGSAIIGDDVFIGCDATVAGPITIESGAYICAGAVVTKPVPPQHVAYGVNKMIHYSKWQGDLQSSPFFREYHGASRSQGTQ